MLFSRVAKVLSPAYFCVSAARRIAAMEILSSFDVVLEGKGDRDQNGELLVRILFGGITLFILMFAA